MSLGVLGVIWQPCHSGVGQGKHSDREQFHRWCVCACTHISVCIRVVCMFMCVSVWCMCVYICVVYCIRVSVPVLCMCVRVWCARVHVCDMHVCCAHVRVVYTCVWFAHVCVCCARVWHARVHVCGVHLCVVCTCTCVVCTCAVCTYTCVWPSCVWRARVCGTHACVVCVCTRVCVHLHIHSTPGCTGQCEVQQTQTGESHMGAAVSRRCQCPMAGPAWVRLCLAFREGTPQGPESSRPGVRCQGQKSEPKGNRAHSPGS